MSAIFISHSSEDNEVVNELVMRLSEQGHHSVFVDFDPDNGIPAGVNWEQLLYSKLRNCHAVIVICTPYSMESKWCFAEITLARSMGKPLFPVIVDACETQSILSQIQTTDLSSENGYSRLWLGLKNAGLEDVFTWDGERAPYPGLSTFKEKDAPLFFGRKKDIQKGIDLLRQLRSRGEECFVTFLGASGSGKSSLIRAGLIPYLKKDKDNWIVTNPFRPNDHLGNPFYNLAEVLNSALGHDHTNESIEQTQNQLMEESNIAHPLLQKVRDIRVNLQRSDATVLLIIDQFEEIIQTKDNKSTINNLFLKWLSDAVLQSKKSPNCPLIVLTTMRSDFLIKLQQTVVFESIDYISYPVNFIPKSNLGELIEGPANLVGLELKSGLVTKILEEIKTENALPLLSFTMSALWERYGHNGKITIDDYDELGGVRGSVKKVAEEAFPEGKISKYQENKLHQAFFSMIEIEETGQYRSRKAQLSKLPDEALPILEQLVKFRLLVKGENEDTIEVTHESFFQEWSLTSKWLIEDRKFFEWHRRFKIDLDKWLRLKQDNDALLRGSSLTEANRWFKNYSFAIKDQNEQNFLNRSVAVSKRKTYFVSTICLILFLIISWKYLINQDAHELYRVAYSVCTLSQDNDCEINSLQKNSSPDDYLLGFIEINSQGMPLDYNQEKAFLDEAYKAAADGPLIIITYIHSWRHETLPGDSALENFRHHLTIISKIEAHQASKAKRSKRNIIGLYLGWEGSSNNITALVENLTFSHRNEIAVNIGQGVTELFLKLEEITNINNVSSDNNRLIIIGDGLGGTAVFSGLYQILMDRNIGSSAVQSSDGLTKGFGDLIMLLNPTIEANRYFPIFNLAQQKCSYFGAQRPKLVILTSESEQASHIPVEKYLSSLFKPHKTKKLYNCKLPIEIDEKEASLSTVGHYSPLITHTLKYPSDNAKNNLHYNKSFVDLWSRQKKGGSIKFGGVLLTHLAKTAPLNPYLNIQVDEEIISDHHDTRNEKIQEFINALIILSTEY